MQIRHLLLGGLAALSLAAAFSASAYASPPPISAVGMSPGYYLDSKSVGDIINNPTFDMLKFIQVDPALAPAMAIPVADASYMVVNYIDSFDSGGIVSASNGGCGNDVLIKDGFGLSLSGGHLSAAPACALGSNISLGDKQLK